MDGILRIGPVHPPLSVQDLDLAGSGGLGEWCQVVEGLHLRFSDFIHRAVVHRREEAVRGWRNWLREDPLVHPFKWLSPDLVPPAPFLQCDPLVTPGGSGVLADPGGQRETRLEEFTHEVDGLAAFPPGGCSAAAYWKDAC